MDSGGMLEVVTERWGEDSDYILAEATLHPLQITYKDIILLATGHQGAAEFAGKAVEWLTPGRENPALCAQIDRSIRAAIAAYR